MENLKHEIDVVHAGMMIVNILMTMERTVNVIGMFLLLLLVVVMMMMMMMMIMLMMVMLMAIKN